MSRYASNTTVGIGRSQDEIRTVLRRYGVTSLALVEHENRAGVQFTIKTLAVKIDCPLPNRSDAQTTPTGRVRRSETVAEQKYAQANRQVWRALLLAIKAKLEVVESGIATVEEEFMPYIVATDGRCLKDHLVPRLLNSHQATMKLLTAG
jgi:hypothetical protein